MNNLIYGIAERPRKIREWAIYSLQMVLAIFVATVLIANICGTDVSAALLGACVGTIVYQVITGFQSPMFISSCGATVSAVCGALSVNGTEGNYLMVICGGAIILLIYAIMALIIKKIGMGAINKILPPAIVGSITVVIGMNLAKFLVTYCGQGGGLSLTDGSLVAQMIIAIITMLTVAIVSHYGKGFLKNIPFLIGIGVGYVAAIITTYCFGIPLVDFSTFKDISIVGVPEAAFTKIDPSHWSWANLGQTALYFVPVALAAVCEHWADHRTLSGIVGTDLTITPGMHKTLLGDGVASCVGTMLCGLPNTSYGESIATIGFSRVASVWVTSAAALLTGALAFIPAVSALINSIPACVFGGCAMILYGYIAASGLRTLSANVNLDDNKSLILVSVVLTVGVSGVAFLTSAFGGVSLALIIGLLVHLILRPKKANKEKEV